MDALSIIKPTTSPWKTMDDVFTAPVTMLSIVSPGIPPHPQANAEPTAIQRTKAKDARTCFKNFIGKLWI
jgi:hypothetical protein